MIHSRHSISYPTAYYYSFGWSKIRKLHVDYAEHPLEGAIREVSEELGVNVEISGEDIVQIAERIFTNEGIQFLSFTYKCTVIGDLKFAPKQDEIEEARWFTIKEALSRAASLFDVEALRALES